MTNDGEPHLITVVRKVELSNLCVASIIFGGVSLFVLYVGTVVMKLSVLAATPVAVFGVRRHRVFPFGNLWSNRTRSHLKDPVLDPLVLVLEEQKRRHLSKVSTFWFVLEASVSLLGIFYPSGMTAGISKMGHVLPFLESWPGIQVTVDWLFIAPLVGIFGLGASATILWLSFYLLALRRPNRSKQSRTI